MIARITIAAALAVTLTLGATAWGHEGHPHKVLGTVAGRHANHLDVKTRDGKAARVVLNEKTKIRRGKSPATADDIRSGERVVVTAWEVKEKDGTSRLVATEVRLAEQGGAAK